MTLPRFVGANGCRDCHSTRGLGDQYGRWRESAHARAYATLATPPALEVGARLGVRDPQGDERCLRCHVTGRDAPLDRFFRTFRIEDGVQCEACHGPGSEYRNRDAMLDRRRAESLGLRPVSEDTCKRCHNAESPTFKPFDFEEGKRRIAHPLAPRGAFVPDHEVPWDDSLPQGVRLAEERRLPLFIDFHPGRGCPRCEEMAAVLANPRVVQAARRMIPVRVEGPSQEFLQAQGLPDCAERIQLPDGRIVKDLLGFIPAQLLAHVLARGLDAAERELGGAPGPEAAGAAGAASTGDTTKAAAVTGQEGAAAVEHVFELLASFGDNYRPTAERKLLAVGTPALLALGREAWSLDAGRRQSALALLTSTLRRRWEEWHARRLAWEIVPALATAAAQGADGGAAGTAAPSPALEPLPDEIVLDLLAFAQDPDNALRLPAVEGLGYLLDPRPTAPLTRYLVRDPDARISHAAYQSLWRLRDAASVRPLLELAADPPCANRTCACRVDSLTVVASLAKPEHVPALLALLKDDFLRAPALVALAEAGDPAAIEPAARLLADPKQPFAVRNEALFTLAKLLRAARAAAALPEAGARAAAQAFAALGADPNEELRAGVFETLGVLGEGDVATICEAARSDASPIPRAYAGFALGCLLERDAGTHPPASSKLTPELRALALETLDRLANEASPLPRVLALDALLRAGYDTRSLLREALHEKQGKRVEDRKALAEAARALERTADPEAVSRLRGLLDDSDLDTSRVAGAWLDAVEVRRGAAPRTGPGVPVELPRILFAGVGGTLVDEERARILAGTRAIVAGYQEAPASVAAPGGSSGDRESASPAATPGADALRAELLEVRAGAAAGAATGAAGPHRWLRLALPREKGTTAATPIAAPAALPAPSVVRVRLLLAGEPVRVLYQTVLTPAAWARRFAGLDSGAVPDLPAFAVHTDGERFAFHLASAAGPLPPLPPGDLTVELLGPWGRLRAPCARPK
ncbi:MAG: HEAT repeat domain-containing protein [Planctomycetes bacterium]|nr:HEAT repeat domain-containing protein [Planctomycetota bacterium]